MAYKHLQLQPVGENDWEAKVYHKIPEQYVYIFTIHYNGDHWTYLHYSKNVSKYKVT